MAAATYQLGKSLLNRQLKNLNSWVPNRTAGNRLGQWTDVRMQRDVENRKVVEKFAKERLRVNSIRKNTILPKEIQVHADREIHAMPRRSSVVYLHNRCILTSRPRGLVVRWRMSRMAWRHLADHNNLSGVQRAMW